MTSRTSTEELKRDGFVVDRQINLTGDTMRQALDRFYARIERGTAALIFFDGFGIQSNRQTYLLPVDAQIWTEPDVSRDGFSLDAILAEMNTRGAAIKIALIDASRRNPFERRFRRYSAGLAPTIAPSNSLMLYSAALGAVCGVAARPIAACSSPSCCAKCAHRTSAPEQALTNTKNGVVGATNREQVPWLSSSLTIGVFLRRSGDAAAGQQEPRSDPVEARAAETGAAEAGLRSVAARRGARAPTTSPGIRSSPISAARSRPTPTTPSRATSAARSMRSSAPTRPAMQDFDVVIRRAPGDAEALNNRCWTRAATGDLQGALADCNLALQIDPGLSDALDSRGLVNLKLGRTAEAIKDYTDAIQRNPRSSSSLFGRVRRRPQERQRRHGRHRPGEIHEPEHREGVCGLRRDGVRALEARSQ